MEIISGEWGKEKVFALPLVTYGATDWLTGVTIGLGDVQIQKDNGAYSNIPLAQLTVVADVLWIKLLNTDVNFKNAIIRVKDQDATKIFEDTGAILCTSVKAWIQSLFSLIESQRGSHTGKAELIYWNPVDGNDANSGLVYHEPKKTYTYNGTGGVHSLLSNNDHQIVIGLPSTTGGPTTVNEYLHCDKNYTFFRHPGRDWLYEATHNEASAVLFSAEGGEFLGCRVKSRSTGNQDAILMTGDFTLMRKVHIDYSRGSGFVIQDSSSNVIDDCLVQDAARGGTGHAMHIIGDNLVTRRNLLLSCRIIENNIGADTDGIRIEGVNSVHNFIVGADPYGMIIHANSGWGINEIAGANHTMVVGPRVHVQHNTLGAINLTGANSIAENYDQWGRQGLGTETLETLKTLINSMQYIAVTGGGGTPTPSYAGEGVPSDIVQGDVVYIPRYLVGDYSANRLFWGAKSSTGDAVYAIPVRECTNISYSAVTGNTSYLIPFVASDTSSVTADIYKSETEIRDTDGISTPVTGDRFDINVIGQIVTP